VNIRQLRLDDMLQIADLLATRDGFDRKRGEDRTAIMAWIAFRNPFMKPGQPTYFVAEDAGRIVAIHGRMPVMFSVRGKTVRGYYVHDLYVHKEYREKGKGFWLTMELAKTIERETDSFFSLYGMTDLNLLIQRRRRYHEMSFDAFIKVLRPAEAIDRFVRSRALARFLGPIAWVGLRIADMILLPRRAASSSVSRVQVFDHRFDEFFQRISPKLGICTVKSSAYLDWKYGSGPCREDWVLVAQHLETIKGFLVVGKAPHRDRPAAVIKDFVADPEDRETVRSLLVAAILHCRGKGYYSIRCAVSDVRFARHLRRLMFLPMAGHEFVFLGNLDKVSDEAVTVSEIRNWHVTLGESDIFMMSGGTPPEEDVAGLHRNAVSKSAV